MDGMRSPSENTGRPEPAKRKSSVMSKISLAIPTIYAASVLPPAWTALIILLSLSAYCLGRAYIRSRYAK